MKKEEVKELMTRIKSHYSTFTTDDYKFNEWFKELQNFDGKDVHKKLESNLNSPEFSEQEPKLYFLTRYLKPINVNAKEEKCRVHCPLCDTWIKGDEFDTHYGRCSSVNYVIKKSKVYLKKDLDRDTLMTMPEDEFQDKYDKLLRIIQRDTKDEREKQLIGFIFNPPKEINLEEII